MEGHPPAPALAQGTRLVDARMAAPAGQRRGGRAGTVAQSTGVPAQLLAALAQYPRRTAAGTGLLARGVRGHGRLPVLQGLRRAMSHQGERAGFPRTLPAALPPALPAPAAPLPHRLAGILHAVVRPRTVALQRHHGQRLGTAHDGKACGHGGQPAHQSHGAPAGTAAMAGEHRHAGRAGGALCRGACAQRHSGAGQFHPVFRDRTTGGFHRIGRAAGPACLAGTAARQRQAAAGARLPARLRARGTPPHPRPAGAGPVRHPAGGPGPGHDAGVPSGVRQDRRHPGPAPGTVAAGMAAAGAGGRTGSPEAG